MKSHSGRIVFLFSLLQIACTGEQILQDKAELITGEATYHFSSPQKTTVPGTPRFDLYFTQPGTSNSNGIDPIVDDDIASLIDSAISSIDLALFDFDRQNIISAVIAAKNRGVTVRMVGDGDNVAEAGYVQLGNAGIPIVLRPAGSAIMHHKFAIIDNRYVIGGSMNWSDNCIARNNNHAVIIESPLIAAQYKLEFDEMFVGRRFGAAKNNVMTSHSTVVNGATIEYYVGPKDALMAQLMNRVDTANFTIHFMIFTFTHDGLRDQIIAKKNAGVQVFGVFDNLQAQGQYSEDTPMALAGVPTWLDGNNNSIGSGGGMLHHKVMIIDGASGSDPMVVIGSYNWTDAATTTNDENMMIIRSPLIAQAFLAEFCAVVSVARKHSSYIGNPDTGCGGKISINEVMANPTGTDAGNEYVEIVNSGIGSVNIGGWTIRTGSTIRHRFPAGFTIPAAGVSLIFDSGVHTEPGAVNSSSGVLSLANTGGTVTLHDAAGVMADTFTYGNTTEGTSHNRNGDAVAAAPIVLHNAVSGASGTRSPGLRANQTPFAGVGAVANSLPQPIARELIITQFTTRGATSALDEFVEIYNNTSKTLDIAGVKIQYQAATCSGWSDRLTIPAGVVLAPGQYYLAANTAGYVAPTSGVLPDATLSSAGFADNGVIRLLSAQGSALDLVAYGTGLSCSGEGNTVALNHGTAANSNAVSRKPGNFTNAYPAQDTDNNAADFRVSPRNVHNSVSPAEPSYGTITPVAGEIIITQFTTRGAASASDEFVEIYNNSRKNLTIDGVKIQYQTSSCASWSDRLTIAAGTTLAPGQFYLAANTAGYVSPGSGPAPDGILSSSGFADNAVLRLLSASAIPLDLVVFGSGLSCTGEGGTVALNHGTAANSASVIRKPGEVLSAYSIASPVQDSNNNSTDFAVRSARNARNRASAPQPSR